MGDPRTGPPWFAPPGWVRRYGGLLVVMAVAAILRLSELTEWWLNPDEGIYYSILTRETFAGFWSEVVTNAHPPLYYLLLRAMGAFTWDFLWFRVFSVICGLIAVAGAWAAGRELVDRSAPDGFGTWDSGSIAGLVAATVIALSPGAVQLSQVMRPYALQLALLLWGLYFLLRYLMVPTGKNLWGYLVLLMLALLTHYSSVLALAAFAGVVLVNGFEEDFRRPAWRRLVLAHVLPVALVGILYVVHVRSLAQSALATDALDGWLSFYMIDSWRSAWLAYFGFQSLVVGDWLRGPVGLLLLVVPLVSFLAPDRRSGVLVLGAIAVGAVAAATNLYPLGATRHSTWMMAFAVPPLGWFGARCMSLTRPRSVAVSGVVVALLAAGGPVGRLLGADQAPWAPTDRVLRSEDLSRMIGTLDPEGEPELMIMSSQTFYLLLPFFPRERERADHSPDGEMFVFPYGTRWILVGEAWQLTADPHALRGDHLARILFEAGEIFPELRMEERERAVLLVGGWRPPLVDELTSPSMPEPIVLDWRYVPGLFSFVLDLTSIRRVWGPG